VSGLAELIFAVAEPIELLGGSFPLSFVSLEVEVVVFALLFFSFPCFFGVRILVRVSRKDQVVKEVLLFGPFFNSLALLDRLTL